jgi:hypothetical protein
MQISASCRGFRGTADSGRLAKMAGIGGFGDKTGFKNLLSPNLAEPEPKRNTELHGDFTEIRREALKFLRETL